MKITWLGQAGLMLETDGVIILVDPYLSNSVAKIQPHNQRKTPVDERFLRVKPDIILLTHNHLDHTDEETLRHYLGEDTYVTVLAPSSSFEQIRKFGGLKNSYICFNDGSSWTEKGIRFQAVKAEHSDEHAVGFIISVGKKHYYITGDTLYSEKVFQSLPKLRFEAVFLPVNGVGNNMNFDDAKRFVKRIKTKYAVPYHIGLFDDLSAENWDCEKKIIPKIYEEIKIKG